MLKESAICAAAISVGILLVCLSLGVDLVRVWYLIMFFAALPFLGAAWLQFRLMGAISHGKANTWLDSPRWPRWRTAPVALKRPAPLIESLPQPEQVRLVPVRSYDNSANLVSEVKIGAEIVRTVPVHVPRLIDHADERDLVEFVDGLPLRGHAIRGWLHVKLSSGRAVDRDYYETLIAPLVKCGAIINRRPRAAGKLVLEPDAIKERLGLCARSVQTV